MRLLEPDREADVYAISCELGLTRIGVAADARERLRAMQVGSPVPLELAGRYHYRSADEAYAATADLRRQLADRHERGGWYRVTGAEVRQAIGNRSARQAPREAAEAREEAAATVRELDEQEHERVRQRRRSRAAIRKQKLRALARLLAEGKTQRAAAAELGVSERTIHRWMRQPGFARELTKATSRHERDLERERKREQTRRNHNERRRLRRHNPKLYYELYSPATPPERRRAQPPAAAPAQPAPRSRHRQQSHTVPSFPNTREGQRQRLAHYEARKLDSYPAFLDYNDVKAGRETPAERRVREQGNLGRRRT
jgi:hypothetical protein